MLARKGMTVALNRLAHHIPASPTLLMSERATALQKAGHMVINLSVGEPDLPVPFWVQQAAVEAVTAGHHRYTPVAGLLELRSAIVEKLTRENSLTGYAPDQVVVGIGAKQVIHNAFMISLSEGEEVLIPSPYWVSYPLMVEIAGGQPKIIPCSEDTQFKLTPHALKQAITEKTRWLILNSPSNPTGAVYHPDELKALAEVLLAHPQVWILSDDIYEHLVYSPARFVSLLEVEPRLRERFFLVNGVSKSFSMTGWRIGYGVGPKAFIQALVRFQSHTTSGACCIAQWAAVAALSSDQAASFLQERRAIFAERRNHLIRGLSSISPITFSPEGAFYLYWPVTELMAKKGISSDLVLANQLLEQAFVSSVPGTEFGMPGYVRLSYARPLEEIQLAVERLTQWVL